MLNSQRTFVTAVKKYCGTHGITVEVKSDGWLIIMRRGALSRLAFGYDLGLNSAVAHRVANDKSATAEVLRSCGVACVPHALFLHPELNEYVPPRGSWAAMLELLERCPEGVVVKPNEGTSGRLVFKVRTKSQLERAAHRIFSANLSLSISPYLEIESEVRVVLIDYVPMVVYSKNRPAVVGDGQHSVIQRALATLPAERLSAMLPGIADGFERPALDAILPLGQRQVLNWRHNLDSGAEPALLESGEEREACVDIAIAAARSIGLRFGSVDAVRVEGSWRILEINSGVMMEALSKRHPELVDAAYGAALDSVFREDSPAT